MFVHRTWNFNIDRFLNPFVPAPPWRHIPYPIAWWFGYRKTKAAEAGNLMPIFWAFIGIFCSIAVIEAVSKHVPSFPSHNAPLIVGSFGAAAVLEFYVIESPLAQPRNAIGGQLISCIIGVSVAKLFQLNDNFEDIKWLGGALACASATALMALTKTVHPPAGATALLAVVDSDLVVVGWFLIPVVLLGCALMLGVALLINNLERRFPVYWWTPEDLRQTRPIFRRRRSSARTEAASESTMERKPTEESSQEDRTAADLEANLSRLSRETSEAVEDIIHEADILIKPGQVIVPQHVYLTQEEEQLLETISKRL